MNDDESLGTKIGAPGPRRDCDADRIRFGSHAHRLRSVEGDRAQVTGGKAVLHHALLLRGVELVLAVGDLHPEDLRRAEQPIGVLAQPEDRRARRGLIAAHALEDAHSVMQRVGQHMRGRVAPRHQLAVVPDEPVAVCHRHVRCVLAEKRIILTEIAAHPDRPGSAEHLLPEPIDGRAPLRLRRGIDARGARALQADLML